MKVSYDAQHDRAVMDLGMTEDATRLPVTPWLTLLMAGDRAAAIEVQQARRHLAPDVLFGEILVGVKEAADLFGVQRSNFVRDLATRPDFPAPIAELASTRVWRRSELLDFRARLATALSFDDREGHPKRRAMNRIRNNVSDALAKRSVSDDARRWLPEMTTRLVRRFRPDRIILFGSQAKGQARRDSDVDLLVVLPRLEGRKIDSNIAMRHALRGIPVGKDIVITTPDEIARFSQVRGVVLHDALKEGVVLYDRAAVAR